MMVYGGRTTTGAFAAWVSLEALHTNGAADP